MNNIKNINSNISSCLEKCNLFDNYNTKISKSIYKNEDEYQNSFNDIIKFSESIPSSKKKILILLYIIQTMKMDYTQLILFGNI